VHGFKTIGREVLIFLHYSFALHNVYILFFEAILYVFIPSSQVQMEGNVLMEGSDLLFEGSYGSLLSIVTFIRYSVLPIEVLKSMFYILRFSFETWLLTSNH
jgi:hypothetical protein